MKSINRLRYRTKHYLKRQPTINNHSTKQISQALLALITYSTAGTKHYHHGGQPPLRPAAEIHGRAGKPLGHLHITQ
jgi:hypothetical protein